MDYEKTWAKWEGWVWTCSLIGITFLSVFFCLLLAPDWTVEHGFPVSMVSIILAVMIPAALSRKFRKLLIKENSAMVQPPLGEVSQQDENLPNASEGSNMNVVFWKCPKCGKSDALACGNCQKFESMELKAENNEPYALCGCGQEIRGLTCSCGTIVYSKFFYGDQGRAEEYLLKKEQINSAISANTLSANDPLGYKKGFKTSYGILKMGGLFCALGVLFAVIGAITFIYAFYVVCTIFVVLGCGFLGVGFMHLLYVIIRGANRAINRD